MTTLTKKDEAESVGAARGRPSFTPGPWEVWKEHARVYAGPSTQNTPSTMSGIRGCIAECDEDDWGDDDEEGAAIAQANATLIAAAPDLYEALRAAYSHSESNRWRYCSDGRGVVHGILEDALAKAEGRSAPEAPHGK